MTYDKSRCGSLDAWIGLSRWYFKIHFLSRMARGSAASFSASNPAADAVDLTPSSLSKRRSWAPFPVKVSTRVAWTHPERAWENDWSIRPAYIAVRKRNAPNKGFGLPGPCANSRCSMAHRGRTGNARPKERQTSRITSATFAAGTKSWPCRMPVIRRVDRPGVKTIRLSKNENQHTSYAGEGAALFELLLSSIGPHQEDFRLRTLSLV